MHYKYGRVLQTEKSNQLYSKKKTLENLYFTPAKPRRQQGKKNLCRSNGLRRIADDKPSAGKLPHVRMTDVSIKSTKSGVVTRENLNLFAQQVDGRRWAKIQQPASSSSRCSNQYKHEKPLKTLLPWKRDTASHQNVSSPMGRTFFWLMPWIRILFLKSQLIRIILLLFFPAIKHKQHITGNRGQ